ncbi:hypothetical protein DFH29DRAFT_295970 [Suillus ampliporus]|nr:hypothetical protein DFH29DRAFT_295970 [Suillus ampliporus]
MNHVSKSCKHDCSTPPGKHGFDRVRFVDGPSRGCLCLFCTTLSTKVSIAVELMHRALLLSEILLDIFAHVNTILDPLSYGEKSLARKSLAALARACQTFHEPAMDELWADIYGLRPLLGCVTRLYPMIYHSGKYLWSSEGIEPLCEHEARQFLRHAARVRSLQIPFDNHFHLLSVLPIETCMFPRLLSLSMVLHPTGYLHLFLSPTLRRCLVPAVHLDLKSIATRCAALEDLSVKIPYPYQSTADELSLLSDSIRLCKRLVTLSCPPLDWAAWEHLSNLPTLCTVAIFGEVLFPLDRDNFTFAFSLNVTTLSFHVNPAPYVITVMEHVEFPSLKDFKMIVRTLPWADAEQLFRALLQCKATIEDIDISSRDQGVREPSGGYLTAITQFLCFTQLRTLRLAFPHSCIDLDNDLLLEAMSSWPHIRALKLDDPVFRPATITFRGLLAGLRQCPHLHTLHILMDAMNVDLDPKAESFQHASLQTLDVRSSHTTDSEAVAHIILSMLPCVKSVIHSYSGRYVRYAWYEVNRRLESFKSSAALGCHITGAAAGI